MNDEWSTPLADCDAEVGDASPELIVEDLGREDFVKYAGASGDFNPIHYDVPYARDAGNPDVIAQGMLTAGFAAHLAADWLGLANVTRFRVRFQSRVFPGDTITVTGEVTNVTQIEVGTTVEVALGAKRHTGETVLSGSVTATLPRLPDSTD